MELSGDTLQTSSGVVGALSDCANGSGKWRMRVLDNTVDEGIVLVRAIRKRRNITVSSFFPCYTFLFLYSAVSCSV